MKTTTIALVTAALVGAGVGFAESSLMNSVGAATGDVYKTRIDIAERSLSIRPSSEDWSPYIAANSARLKRWLETPPGAEYFAEQYIQITFARPVGLAEFHQSVDPILGIDGKLRFYGAVGKRPDGRWGEEWTIDTMPDETLFIERAPPPRPDGTRVTYVMDGIMAAYIQLGAGGVSPEVLAEVEKQGHVYLVDTTAVHVVNELRDITFDSVSLKSPFYLLLR